MRRLVNNIISVLFSLFRFTLFKMFHWKNFKFYPIERLSPNVVTEFNRGSLVYLGKRVRIHSGTKLKIRSGGRFHIYDNVKINYYCIIVCHEYIEIGEGTELGPYVCIYDHDHDYKAGLKANSFLTSPISIGKNCWIGAGSIILRGTKIGDNCIIGAGSIVKGTIPPNTVYVQRRVESIMSYEYKDVETNN